MSSLLGSVNDVHVGIILVILSDGMMYFSIDVSHVYRRRNVMGKKCTQWNEKKFSCSGKF